MNSSICTADRQTHVRIVVTALLVAIAVVWVAISVRPAASAPECAPAKATRPIAAPVMMAAAAPVSPVR